MKYWDSSALVPLLVSQLATRRMAALFRRDREIITWWGSRVECDSAIARLEREGKLTAESTHQALERLDALAAAWQEIQPVDLLRETARRLLRAHRLRSAGALQLAAAGLASEGRPATLELVCLDERLSIAAQREGFAVARG